MAYVGRCRLVGTLCVVRHRRRRRRFVGAWPSLSGGHSAFSNSATTHSASSSSEGSNVEAGRMAQELLRQAMVELDANRFETARRLTRRAAAIGVTAGFVGVHPEQVLAEIDRRERDAAGANRMVSADSGRSHKARRDRASRPWPLVTGREALRRRRAVRAASRPTACQLGQIRLSSREFAGGNSPPTSLGCQRGRRQAGIRLHVRRSIGHGCGCSSAHGMG